LATAVHLESTDRFSQRPLVGAREAVLELSSKRRKSFR